MYRNVMDVCAVAISPIRCGNCIHWTQGGGCKAPIPNSLESKALSKPPIASDSEIAVTCACFRHVWRSTPR